MFEGGITMSLTNLLVTGVGGQGVLMATDIIAKVAARTGLDVKKSEVHGVAQRLGAVVSNVRYGEKVYSPIGKVGDINLLIAFEELEALRYAHWVKSTGTIIVNEQKVMPTLFSGDNRHYPDGIIEFLRSKHSSVIVVPAYKLALGMGNLRIVNIIMCGALSKMLEFRTETWEKVIKEYMPEKVIELNLQAFTRGQEIIVGAN